MTLENFAHIVSHDLKAPLHGIASLVEFVVEDYGDRLEPEGRAQLAMVQSLAGRAVAMIDGLRRFSRVATADVRLRPLDLTAVLARVTADVLRRHPEWTATPVITTLPAVQGDPALIPLLFDVLVDNALRFSERETRRIEIAPYEAAPAPDGFVAIAVSDDGIGVPAKYRQDVFAMFKRLHPADAYGGGIGAGLAIAQCIAEAHGGRIYLADRDGPGATVVVTLPHAVDAGEPTSA